jgi:hypothetical protein
MALQTEDVVDCLQVKYPFHDIILLFDQSSGHAKKRNDGLNTVELNMKWGGNQKVMRDSVIIEGCLGPYQASLRLGDIQSMNFKENDEGPTIMNSTERLERRIDRSIGRYNRKRTKAELLQQLIDKKDFQINQFYTKKALEDLTKNFQLDLEIEVDQIEEGWLGKPKGLYQILYEQGWINVDKPISEYSIDGKAIWKDENGNVFAQYLPFCLRHLLLECPDFKNEVTALEDLAFRMCLPTSNVEIMYTPKYHCEIAGEGIEYSWGLAKKKYRHLPLIQKKGIINFKKSVKECVNFVTVDHVRRFAAVV